MTSARPFIGLNVDSYPATGGAVSGLRPEYWQSIVNAGGVPFLLPPLRDPKLLESALARLDGMLLIGGDDIRGERYGCATLPTSFTMEEAREFSDFALIDQLIQTETPTLAICLGFQELNIRQGGSLYQDLTFDAPTSPIRHYAKLGPIPTHPVEISDDSHLSRALGLTGRIEVNSKHHQGVNRLGSGLRVTAQAPDGLIESFELEDHPFFLAVQWHPEQMVGDPIQPRLFSALVEASAGNGKVSRTVNRKLHG